MNPSTVSDRLSKQQTGKDLATGHFLPGNSIGRQFQPGQSGNPRGRPPNAGRSVKETLNDLFDHNDLTRADLQHVIDDPASHPRVVIACQSLLDACQAGSDGRHERNLIINQTDGRPVQTAMIGQLGETHDPEQLLREAQQYLEGTAAGLYGPDDEVVPSS